MKSQLFKVTVLEKCRKKIELHLIDVAQQWSQGNSVEPIVTLKDFCYRLQKEHDFFRWDNPDISSTVMIDMNAEGMLLLSSPSRLKLLAIVEVVKQPVTSRQADLAYMQAYTNLVSA